MHNDHRNDDSRDSTTFMAVVIALAILLFVGGVLLVLRIQYMRALQAREMEMRAREAVELARQQQIELTKEMTPAEE